MSNWLKLTQVLVLLVWSVFKVSNVQSQSVFSSDNNDIVNDMKGQCDKESQNTKFIDEQDTDFSEVNCPQVYFSEISTVRVKRLCNRSDTFTYPLKSMVQFVQLMEKMNWKFMYLGDSIQREMYYSFLCAVEGEDPHMLQRAKDRLLIGTSPFLSTAPTGCKFISNEYSEAFMESMQWYHDSIKNNITHVVFNTGAWWSYAVVKELHSPQQSIVENVRFCYEKQFSVNSTLFRLLHRLKEHHGVTPIWRDTAPGGVCQGKRFFFGKHTYYKTFTSYNSIASRFVTSQLNGLVIPKVWETSLDKWRDHVGMEDMLHWCVFKKLNVPSIWNTLLYDLLLQVENNAEKNDI